MKKIVLIMILLVSSTFASRSTVVFEDDDEVMEYSLNIKTTPRNSKIVIEDRDENIYNYYPNIRLENGRYKITISKNGYKTKKATIDLKDDVDIIVSLTKSYTSISEDEDDSELIYKGPRGLHWEINISHHKYTYDDAIDYCKKLSIENFDNWRLPKIDELKTLLTTRKYRNSKHHSHYIKQDLVESMISSQSNFWSITKYKSYENKAHFVRFHLGNSYWRNIGHLHYVRCVW